MPLLVLLVLGWIALGACVLGWLLPRSKMSEGQAFAAVALSILIYFGVPLMLVSMIP